MSSWQHFPHQADIGIRGIGTTLSEAFAGAALALSAVITDPATIRADETVAIRCAAPDSELLLVDWLNALVFEMTTRHMLFSRFEVRISGGRQLEATVWGEHIDPARHQPAVEVKGATYTALRVGRQVGGEWLAQCVVDV
ncbi:MAG: archease [Gammaproteobacteria bacterium]|nr:archease [Gammaproteobacteria bacterium]